MCRPVLSQHKYLHVLKHTSIFRRGELGHGVLQSCRSRWPCRLRRSCTTTWSVALRVRIPLRAWVLSVVFVVCCVGSGLSDEPIVFRRALPRARARVSNYMWLGTSKRGGVGPRWVVAPQTSSKLVHRSGLYDILFPSEGIVYFPTGKFPFPSAYFHN